MVQADEEEKRKPNILLKVFRTKQKQEELKKFSRRAENQKKENIRENKERIIRKINRQGRLWNSLNWIAD